METMCPKCGAKIVKEENFCANCGVAIKRKEEPSCKKCGGKLNPWDKFCGSCGNNISKKVVDKPTIKAEINKPLTVAPMISKNIISEKSIPKGTEYFCVPFSKLAILYLPSFGIYPIYWFYKNWKAIKTQEKEDIHPLWRGWLFGIYSYSLFKRILSSAEKQGYQIKFSAGTLYVSFILGGVLANHDVNTVGSITLIGIAMICLPIYSIQKAIEFNNSKINPGSYKKDYKFTFFETFITVIVGGFIFLIVLSS